MNKLDRDRLFDLYVAGNSVKRVAELMELTPGQVREWVNGLEDDPGYLATYKAERRISRKGKPLSVNEGPLIKAWREAKVPDVDQARFLQRDLSELGLDRPDLEKMEEMKKAGAGVDLIQAYRYLYYVKRVSIVEDRVYDALEKEEIEYGAGGRSLTVAPSSDRAEDYPPHIRALALYLAFKWTVKKEE